MASFKKWQELGRSVNKGETSLRIFAPSLRKVEVERENGETDEVRQVAGFRLVPVFDISQTSGDELPDPVKLLDGEAPEGVFGTLTKVAESIGFSVQVDARGRGSPRRQRTVRPRRHGDHCGRGPVGRPAGQDPGARDRSRDAARQPGGRA